MWDISRIRHDFPLLERIIHGHRLIYLDNAATTQMPDRVIEAIALHYRTSNANVYRGIHTLSNETTSAFEHARKNIQAFIGARSDDEIVFTKGTTDSLNLLARLWEPRLSPKNAVCVSAMEHHANLVPWQQACIRSGAKFLVCPLTFSGEIDMSALEAILVENEVSILSITHCSNVLGTVNPVSDIVTLAHRNGTAVSLDAAQSVRHEVIDVQALDCDFLSFSAHKMMGPTGIGVLYGKYELLDSMDPIVYGGEMVDEVTFEKTSFENVPLRFEAGTPNILGVLGLSAAIDYLSDLGLSEMRSYEKDILAYAEARLNEVDGISVLGHPQNRAGCVSFTVKGVHPFDIATMVNECGIALRSGNQCAQPLLHQIIGVENVTRLSTAFYNSYGEIDLCMESLVRITGLLKKYAG